ncbi:MAG TPA: biotin-dependent carboxyltransferase family protein [Propionibacteriaceae bacterium]|nr:biotin-dependent carboxyltransferase family protein [Propionibacteriaceae bacterium]
MEVTAVGPLALVEDLGRRGLGALGVPTGGAADRAAHRLANRLVGNPEDAATVEVLLGGLRLRARTDLLVAVTGAPAATAVDRRPVAWAAPLHLPAGAELSLGVPEHGIRSYVSVRGGVRAGRVLGSHSGDPTTGLGPAPLRPGDLLRVGPDPGGVVVSSDLTPAAHRWGEVSVRVVLGPADDWFAPDAVTRLTTTAWRVTPHSDRVGIRLEGAALERSRPGERASEGVVRGAVQVPPSGEPLIFLADHPTTGGYPVVAVVVDEDTDLLAQCRPGDVVRMRVVPRPW